MEDSYIIIGLHRIVASIDRKTAHIAKRHGLTIAQFGVLEALYHKGDLTIGEVKEAILSSDGTIPVVVRNLEKRELISRRDDPDDKRRSILSLTPAGRDLIQQVYPQNQAMIQQELSVLSPNQKRQMVSLIKCFKKEWA